ncbi:MAG TPA: EamA family transporter [Phototrophicaceae bacterium]|nr:EamA family transporter [Phototrophicaceae bacterium]
MQKSSKAQASGFWLTTGAAAIWGTIGVATQAIYNVDSTTSLFLNLARLVIATPVLTLICWRMIGARMFSIRPRDLRVMILSGILVATSQASYFAAIHDTGVTIATLLTLCVTPLTVTFISVLLKLEILTRRTVIALICALVGSVLLVGLDPMQGAHENLLLGAFFAFISGATYGGVLVCGRFVAADYNPLQVMSITFAVGTVLLLLANALSGFVTVHTTQGWLLVLYLGLIPTALAYWMFQAGLRSVSATAASIISMLEPMVAALLAWLIFGETLALAGIVGALLLVASIILLSVSENPA